MVVGCGSMVMGRGSNGRGFDFGLWVVVQWSWVVGLGLWFDSLMVVGRSLMGVGCSLMVMGRGSDGHGLMVMVLIPRSRCSVFNGLEYIFFCYFLWLQVDLVGGGNCGGLFIYLFIIYYFFFCFVCGGGWMWLVEAMVGFC